MADIFDLYAKYKISSLYYILVKKKILPTTIILYSKFLNENRNCVQKKNK